MAEHLLRAAVPGLDVASAGTGALVGEPMQPFALAALAGRGIDGSAFRARQLSREMVEGAALVLTAERRHRAAAVTLVPTAAARTFTLRELDRLLAAVTPAEIDRRGLVAAAAGQRGLVPPRRPADDDVADPFRGPQDAFLACAELLERSLRRLVALVAPTPA
jgi:protein-tyrosine phosphatase